MKDDLLTVLKSMSKKGQPSLVADLLTESEQVMLVRRVAIAKNLIAGKTIQHICQELHVGITTVMSVERWLQEKFGEYRSALPPLYEEMREKALARREPPIIPYTFRWMRRKYPMHFLLFNLLLDDIDWERGEQKPKNSPSSYRRVREGYH